MKCRVCSGEDLALFLDLGDQPHCDSFLSREDQPEACYPLQVFFCRTCTTVQIGYTVPKEVMFSEFLYMSGTTRMLTRHFQETSSRLIERLGLGTGDVVIDIGSNDGSWLSCYEGTGIRAVGVDSAANLVEFANAHGRETVHGFFNDVLAQDLLERVGNPRLITAAGVFFHLEELHSVTKGVARLLGEDGVFCVQAIYLGSIVENTQFDQIYHEHLTYWCLGSLEQLLHQYNLEVFSVLPLDIHGGSMEYLIARKGRYPAEASVGELREREAARGYHKLETFERLAERVWSLRDKLWALLNQVRAEGKSVYAFGAPAKGATLLNSFGITREHVTLAVEANPLKFGKLMPGARIPIVDEKSVDPPDVYLMLAWNFLAEFLPRYSGFLSQGGRFLVPFPEPHFVGAR